MKKCILVIAIGMVCFGCGPGQSRGRVLRHMVMFDLKDDVTAKELKEIERSFGELPKKIDAIYDFEWGRDISDAQRAQGFTHCVVLTFRGQADLEEYLPHPAHKEAQAKVDPYIEKMLVIDYWTSRK